MWMDAKEKRMGTPEKTGPRQRSRQRELKIVEGY
jgi:hypothetical protein